MHVDNNGLSQNSSKQNFETITLGSSTQDNLKKNGKTKQRKRDVLEVEDTEQRLIRLQNLLENVDSEPSSASTLSQSVPVQFPLPQLTSSKPHFLPRSEVLSRVESFLPQLVQANAELLKQTQNDPTSVDIENITEDQENYIEMNLGLGVLEQKRKRQKVDGTDSALDSQPDSIDDDETYSSDSSASNSTSRSSSESEIDTDDSSTASDSSSSGSEGETSSSLSPPSLPRPS